MIVNEREVAPGIQLQTLSSGPINSTAAILIGVDVVENATDAEIVRYIRAMVDCAHFTEALNTADWLVGRTATSFDRTFLERYPQEIATLERYAGQDARIDRVIALIDEARTKEVYRRGASAKRRDIQREYDRLFMTIGRRDGFYFASCKHAGNNLQIDHKIALINGGTNDLENLQLLCASCNVAKGDSL